MERRPHDLINGRLPESSGKWDRRVDAETPGRIEPTLIEHQRQCVGDRSPLWVGSRQVSLLTSMIANPEIARLCGPVVVGQRDYCLLGLLHVMPYPMFQLTLSPNIDYPGSAQVGELEKPKNE